MDKIKDLISVNHNAALIRGVQLDWYGDPRFEAENERLVTSYVFSSGAAARDSLTATSIFERVINSLGGGGGHNVFTIVAQYGHGKSHLALVLANYFGRPAEDRLVANIIGQIEASTNQETASRFRSFKARSSKPQLVVRLSGHEFTNLRQGFMKALRRALDESDAGRVYKISAVSISAAKWLRSLEGDKRRQAEESMSARHGRSLDSLIASLESFDPSGESIARALSLELNGVAADFGADLNLKEVIEGVVTALCVGAEAPFHGLIVLFDELGIYAEKWCHDRMAAGDLAPQQLLEACDAHKGTVCLVTFIQRELVEAVRDYANQDDFRKWAERFPPEARFRLESNLEQVIKGLLTKNPHHWSPFARDYVSKVEEACHAGWRILPTYQKNAQQWSESKFINVVGVGAFPLHPITTGLVCNLTFTQGARTVIEVVNTAVEERSNEAAVLPDGRLNFILPIFLVDEFAVNFDAQDSRYKLYLNARDKLGANAPEQFYDVLKALFIFEVGGLKRFENQSHAEVLSQLCGYREAEVAGLLRELDQEYSVVRFVQAKREYEFSGIGVSRSDVRDFVRKQVTGQRIPSLAAKIESLKLLDSLNLPDTEAVKFKADHGINVREWYLTPRLMDATAISTDSVRRIAEQTWTDGDARGTVIYVVSGNPEELEEAKGEAEVVLDRLRAAGVYHYPVVIAVPSSPAADLEQELLIHDGLRNVGQPQREFYGDAYKDAVTDCNRRLNDLLAAYFRYEETSYHVATAIRQTFRGVDADHLDQIASRVFEHAYPHRVPAMSDLMRLNSNPGNSAVAEVARYLLKNDGDFGVLNTAARNLATAVLQDGDAKWGVLNSRNRLQEPTDSRVALSWHELDAAIPEDRPAEFKELNARLQGMPYGHDDYTLTLLYAAWIGLHKNELRLSGSLGGRNDAPRIISLPEFQGKVSRAKDFVKWLHDGKVRIQRPGKLSKKKAEKYLKDLEDASDYDQAVALLAKVEEVVNALPEGDVIRATIITQAQKLNAERKKIRDFEQEVTQYNKLTEGNATVKNLLLVQRAYPQKPETYLTYDDSFYVEGTARLNERLEAEVAKQTGQALARIEQYEAVKNFLREIRDALKQSGRPDLEQLTIDALVRIEEEYKRLVARGKEATVIADVESFNVKDANLAAARKHAAKVSDLLDTKLADASESAREHAGRSLQQTNKRIDALESWLDEFTRRAESADDLQALGAARDEALSHERDYLETPEVERFRELKKRIEERQNELQETAAAESRLQVRRDEFVRAVKESAVRVLRLQSFDVALPEWDELHKTANVPGDLSVTDEQHDVLRDSLKQADDRVEALYCDLLRSRSLQTEQAYATRGAALERAAEALGLSKSAPAEWRLSLTEAQRKLEADLAEWRAAQTLQAEERRRAESERRREEDNRRVLDDALRQTKNASSLREIKNALSTIAGARERLTTPAEAERGGLEAEESRLLLNAEKLRSWVSDVLPAELSAVGNLKDVQTLRQKVATHESLCAGEAELVESLRQARAALDRRADLFNRLNTLERQTVTLERGDDLLSQYAELRSEHPDMAGRVEAAEETLRRRLDALRAAERRKVEEWLRQFRAIDEGELTVKKASDLLNSLVRRPQNLEPEDEEYLTLVRQKLEAVRSRDIANRILDDFARLQTSEQRAECLLRLLEALVEEELPAEYRERFANVFEQRQSAV